MWRAVCLCCCFAACASPRPVVRSQHFDLAGARATLRDFPGGSICEAEPRFLLDELSSVNGLLRRFLDASPGDEGSSWTEAAIALGEDGAARLPPLLEQHDRSLTGLARCEFARGGAWPALVSRGRELVAQTRARLGQFPEQLREFRAAEALAAWRRERLEQQESARAACPQRLTKPIIYFAWREGPRTTWLFCDGAQVTRDVAGRPELEPPPEELHRPRLRESVYFIAAGRFATGAVMVPPGAETLTVW